MSSPAGSDRGAVVITGSSTGIGRACALGLDRAGFEVFAGVRKPEDGEALAAAASERLEPLIVDVTDADAIAAAAERVARRPAAGSPGSSTTPASSSPGPVEAVPLDELPAPARGQRDRPGRGHPGVPGDDPRRPRAGRVHLLDRRRAAGSPYLSPYNASKAALSAVGDSLRQEMRPFGVGSR